MKKFTMPEWTKNLPDNALLNSADVAKIFGYSSYNAMTKAFPAGLVPMHEHKFQGFSEQGKKKAKRFWSVGTLRKYEKEQQNEKI